MEALIPHLFPLPQPTARVRRVIGAASMDVASVMDSGAMGLTTAGTTQTKCPVTVRVSDGATAPHYVGTVWFSKTPMAARPSHSSSLAATLCRTADEFQCRDGGCITNSSRCNQVVDCEDASDEMNCCKSSWPQEAGDESALFSFDLMNVIASFQPVFSVKVWKDSKYPKFSQTFCHNVQFSHLLTFQFRLHFYSFPLTCIPFQK